MSSYLRSPDTSKKRGFFLNIVFPFNFSETAPTQGTLKVFPNVLLSNSYLILRPFFRLRKDVKPDQELDAESWEFGKAKSI